MPSTANIVAPLPVLTTGSGAIMNLTLPMPTVISDGTDQVGMGFAGTMPKALLTAYAGGNAALTLSAPTISMTATFPGIGRAAIVTSRVGVSASGTVSGSANAALTFGTYSTTYRLVGYGGAILRATFTGGFTVEASGTGGRTGSVAITLPLYDLVSASGSTQNYGGASLLMPAAQLGATAQAWLTAPGAILEASGSATIAVSYEAYSVNLNHTPREKERPVDEMTKYIGYPFDRVVRYKNSYYGMNSTGLYLLEGTTDNGAAISFEVRTVLTDAGTEYKKTVESAYFGGRFGPNAAITMYVGESATAAYTYFTPRDSTVQNYRQPLGRGLKTRYFALGVSGSGPLTIDNITFNISQLARKV